jgi:hypothetical protein
MDLSHLVVIYKKLIKHSDYSEPSDVSVIESNSIPLQPTEQYLIKSISTVDESVLNAIFTPIDSNAKDYSLNISCEGVKVLSTINTFFGKLHFEKIDELVQAYIQTGLALNVIRDVSYPAHVNLSWFYTHQTVYQSFGEYYHSIYRDYNKRLAKVSFYDEVTRVESKPLKLTANLNLSVINNKLVPTVVLSIPFIKNKHRMEIVINLNEPFDGQHYKVLFEEAFKNASKTTRKKKTAH